MPAPQSCRIWIPLPVWQIGLVLMLLLTATNLLSTRSYGEFEFWFASIKVAAIVVFIFVAGSYALGFTSPTGATLGNLVAHGGFAPFGGWAVFAGVTGIVFSLTGAEIVTVVAAESSEPSRAIATMTTSLILRILLFYVGSVFCILAIVPWNEIAPGTSPFAWRSSACGIPCGGDDHESDRARGRVVVPEFGLLHHVANVVRPGANGDAPRSMVALDSRGVPTRAILIGSVFGYLAVIASVVSPQQLFTFLVNASGAIMLVIYLLDRPRANPTAARSGARIAGTARDQDVVVSLAELRRRWLVSLLVLASMLFRAAERTQLTASALSVAVVLIAFWWRSRRHGRSAP